jgi:hypothetical protein
VLEQNRTTLKRHCDPERSEGEAIQSFFDLDCFVAPLGLLAMTATIQHHRTLHYALTIATILKVDGSMMTISSFTRMKS